MTAGFLVGVLATIKATSRAGGVSEPVLDPSALGLAPLDTPRPPSSDHSPFERPLAAAGDGAASCGVGSTVALHPSPAARKGDRGEAALVLRALTDSLADLELPDGSSALVQCACAARGGGTPSVQGSFPRPKVEPDELQGLGLRNVPP